MGEIAEMMLDGTMDPETGEFNFAGADGPGWPMTGAEAEAYKRATRPKQSRVSPPGQGTSKKARQRRRAREAAEALAGE